MLALSAACDKTSQLSDGYASDPNAVRVAASVEVLTRSNPLCSAEEQSKFNVGDKISVVHTSANKLVNYKYDGTSWVPEGDDYLVWQTDKKNTFRLQYPFIGYEGLPEYSEYFKNQSTLEEMSRSDLMTKVVEVDPIPTDRRLVATLERQRALVTVKIAGFNDEFDAGNAKITDLKLHLWDGGQGDEIISVTPCIRDGKDACQPKGTAGLVGYSYTAIGRNDCDYQSQNKPFITMTVDGRDLTVANPAPMEIGKHYTYRLVVGKESVKISGVTVDDWTSGGSLDGKFEAEVEDYSEWDGKSVDTSFDGDGTQESPYLITSAIKLAGLAANVNGGDRYNGKYFRLDTNIDLMGQEWTPIGNYNSPFGGTFDGNDKIITNMVISAAPSPNFGVGLFGNCDGVYVSRMVLKNARIAYREGSSSAGLICGVLKGGAVKNCRVEGAINTRNGYSGGIIGEIEDKAASVSDCEVEIHCEKPWGSTGGIVGYSGHERSDLTIESCIVKGEINGGNDPFGGIAGSLNGSNVLVKNCTSYVRLGKSMEGTHPKAGGLVGTIFYGKAENCTVYGGVSFTYESCSVGGMFSEAHGATLSNLKFCGDIHLTIKGVSFMQTHIAAFIAWLGAGTTTAAGCTYKKSGTGDYPVIGYCTDESFDTSTLDIKGI